MELKERAYCDLESDFFVSIEFDVIRKGMPDSKAVYESFKNLCKKI
jgi:hypothetical protein